MEITVKRFQKTNKSTISRIAVNGTNFCFSLEDKDRGLRSDMDLSTIQKIKQYGITAIPAGRYQVVVTYSSRFKQYLPLLLNVPGFAGIRIHPGNKHEDTEGCILPGESYTTDWVSKSKDAFKRLFADIKKAEKKEKIYITVS